MADTKITGLTELAEAPADDDLIEVVDVSDTTMSAEGTNKKITATNLGSGYALLAGRSGGQTLIGGTALGNNLTLSSTSHATKGKILFGDSAYDEVNNRLGIGTTSPSQKLDLVGSMALQGTTTSTTGVIYKGATRFMHNFQHPTGDTAVPAGSNTFLGENAGNFTMGSGATGTYHGSYNTGVGMSALYSNTTGSYNSALGRSALYFNTTGYSNSALGYAALYSNTTGYSNSALGMYALYSNTTGHSNSALGRSALYSNTTGHSNSALGYQAGRYIANGSTANATSSNSLYLGAETKASADGRANEIVIGYNATGLGSNTVVLGNSSVVKTVLRGVLNLPSLNTAPANAGDTGTLGEIRITDSAIYVCTATDTWKKVDIATW